LKVTPSAGNTPQALQVSADPSALAAGSYAGKVTITSPGSAAAQTATVSFVVTAAANAPILSVDPPSLSFSVVQGGQASTNSILVSNTGGGTLSFTASATGGTWLSVSPSSGSATLTAPGSLTVTADPTGLAAGTYNGIVKITAGAVTKQVSVVLSINARSRSILLSQTGLSFQAVSGGGATLPKTFGILNVGGGSMDWSAAATTPDGSSVPWLVLSASSGTVVRPFLDASLVDVSVAPGNLAPGKYSAQIRVTADADNSPQSVTVLLNVVAPGTTLAPEVRPNGLIFTGVQGQSPGSQTVQLATPGTSAAFYRAASLTIEDPQWLLATPNSGQFAPNQPGRIIVSPDFTNLQPGVPHFGAVTAVFSDGSSQTVNVLSVVAPAGTGSKTEPGASGCTASKLNIQYPNSGDNSIVAIGNPANFEVQVVDDCGAPVTSGQNASVKVAFRSGDPSLNLINTVSGKWSKTWTPRAAGASGQTVATTTALLILPNGKLLAQQQDSVVTINPSSGLPLVASGGIVNAASFSADSPLAPGSLITVFGAGLSTGPGQSAGVVPVPTSLNGAEVRLNDQPLPLSYAADGQLNAQIPYGLPLNTQHQLVVRRGNLLSSPEPVLVAAAQPGIFQASGGQGVILNGVTNALADSKAPVKAGDVVVIYCTGLGAVSPAVAAGQAAPSSPLSRTVADPLVTIGGQTAAVSFSGLTPNFAGLYQINATIPAGIAPGDAVPVIISISGQTSPAVTISIR
jgi:uncharacterized protein (TIGR03437 family)